MLGRFAVLTTAAAACFTPAIAADPPAWPLFNGTAPLDRVGYFTPETTETWTAGRVIRNVSHPSLTPFLASADHPANVGAAVVIAPGGAYKWLTWDAEGVDIAMWLNSIGISAFVLKYRVPFRPWLMQPGFGHTFGTAPLIDAQRSVGMVRHRAAALGLNTSRIGFIGFSAGGSVTAHIATNYTHRAYPAIDAADKESCRPDFVMMIYPAYLVNGTSDELMAERVTSAHPPAFLAQTEDDGIHCENSIFYYLALKRAGAPPSELHVYPDMNHKAQHGYGRCLRPKIEDNEVCGWTSNAAQFLLRLGMVAPAPASAAQAETYANSIAASDDAGKCKSAMDCSLLGVCNAATATCTCDPGWTGVDCATADLLPYDDVAHLGYVNTSRASWGGRPLRMPDGTWQLFATEIAAKCPLILFMNNSMVVRAASTTSSPLGPYEHKSTVRSAFAHNPTAVGPTPDGYYLVYSIGGRAAGDARPNPTAWGLDCTEKLPACGEEDRCRSHGTPDGNGQIVLSYTRDPVQGPWTHRVVLPIGGNGTTPPNSDGAWNCKHNNPAALLNATTGAVMIMYHGSSCDSSLKGERLGLADAAHWNDTIYAKRAGPPIVSPNNGTGSHEDPFLWIDSRGNYHALTHNQASGNLCGPGSSSCGAHLYSRDSYAWQVSAHPAYSSAVQLKSNGKVVKTGTRQRPQLVFSDDAERRPIALFNGASFEGNNGDLKMLTHTLAFEFAERGAQPAIKSQDAY